MAVEWRGCRDTPVGGDFMGRFGGGFQVGSAAGPEALAGSLRSLSKLEAFRGISPPKLKRLIERARLTNLPREEEVRFEGEDAGSLYALVQGVTKITLIDEFRRPLLVTVHGAGSLFGGRSLLAPPIIHGFDCVAVRDSVIAGFDAANFLDAALGVSNREFASLIDMTLLRVGEQILHYSRSAGFTVRQRLAFALIDLAAKFGARDARGTLLTLPLTHDLLAEIVDASRQRVTGHLNELASSGAIRRDGRRLILVIPELHKITSISTGPTKRSRKRSSSGSK